MQPPDDEKWQPLFHMGTWENNAGSQGPGQKFQINLPIFENFHQCI